MAIWSLKVCKGSYKQQIIRRMEWTEKQKQQQQQQHTHARLCLQNEPQESTSFVQNLAKFGGRSTREKKKKTDKKQ